MMCYIILFLYSERCEMCPCFCAPQPSLLIIPVTGLYMKLKDKGV